MIPNRGASKAPPRKVPEPTLPVPSNNLRTRNPKPLASIYSSRPDTRAGCTQATEAVPGPHKPPDCPYLNNRHSCRIRYLNSPTNMPGGAARGFDTVAPDFDKQEPGSDKPAPEGPDSDIAVRSLAPSALAVVLRHPGPDPPAPDSRLPDLRPPQPPLLADLHRNIPAKPSLPPQLLLIWRSQLSPPCCFSRFRANRSADNHILVGATAHTTW